MEQFREVPRGRGSRGNQRRVPGVDLVQEELDDATEGTPPRKDDGGGPEVGHGPFDVVLNEVGRGRRQRGSVPPEEHTFNGVCQGLEGR